MSGPVDAFLVLCPPWANPDVPPLGASYLSEYLEARGLRTEIADLNARLFRAAAADDRPPAPLAFLGDLRPRDLWEYAHAALWHHDLHDAFARACPRVREEFLDRLAAARPRVVGFSVYVENIVYSARLAAEVRRALPSARVVFGGPLGFSRLAGNLLPPGTVDLFVTGEGEEIFFRIVRDGGDPRALESDPDVARLDGWAYRPYTMRAPITPLDAVPFPRFARLDLGDYSPTAIQVVASRGCPNRCVFCNDREVFHGFRARSVASVMEELSFHAARGVREVGFNDLNLAARPRHLAALCDALAASGLGLTWTANAGCRGITDDLAARMKRAGCAELYFGLETGSDRVMRAMRKSATAAEAEGALRACAGAGIGAAVNLIAGFPTETEADFAETLAFVERNRASIARASSLNTLHVIAPATLWEDAESRGVAIERDAPYPEVRWRSDSGVDLAVRLDRLRRLIGLFDRLGLPYRTTNYGSDLAIHERFEHADVAIADGAARFEPGARLWRVSWDDRAVTADVGFFFDVLGDGAHLVSHRLDWTVAREGDEVVARGAWANLPLRATARALLVGGALRIAVRVETTAAFAVARLKFGWLVAEDYARWRVGETGGDFPPPGDAPWRVVGPPDAHGRPPLDLGFAWEGDSRIALEPAMADRPFLELTGAIAGRRALPVVQSDCHPGRAAGFYDATPFTLEPGNAAEFSLTLRFQAEG